jgi:hypothetical protein
MISVTHEGGALDHEHEESLSDCDESYRECEDDLVWWPINECGG